MTLASKIRELRKEAKLTQAELARLSAVSIDSIRRWEWGRIIPRANEFVRLIEALNLTQSSKLFELLEVMKGDEKERGKSSEGASRSDPP